jgi:uncharacterized membrane protein YobD (UPF0266 family)
LQQSASNVIKNEIETIRVKLIVMKTESRFVGFFFEFALVSSWFLDGDLVGIMQQENRRID